MRFIDSIVFKDSPPSEFKVEGALWAQSNRLYHKDHSGNSHVLAYVEDLEERSYIYSSPVPQLTHVINHGLNEEHILIQIREDDGGRPGEFVQSVVVPTPGDESNSIVVYLDEALKIHVVIIKP